MGLGSDEFQDDPVLSDLLESSVVMHGLKVVEGLSLLAEKVAERDIEDGSLFGSEVELICDDGISLLYACVDLMPLALEDQIGKLQHLLIIS